MFEVLIAQIVGIDTLPTTPESGGEYVGAVSNLMSAMLQTAGLFSQAEILINFRELLETTGALIYAVAIAGALMSVALYGNYRMAAYLMLGPALFYFMLGNTVEGRATLLRTGNRIVSDTAQDQRRLLAMMGDVDADMPNPQLSWFFVTYDNVVSEVVQNLVALLVNTENNRDMAQAATERVFSRVLLADGIDKGFLKLVSVGVLGQCGEVNRLAIESAQLEGGNAQQQAEQQLLNDRYNSLRTQSNVALDPQAVTYLQTLQNASAYLESCGADAGILTEIALINNTTRVVANCEQVWLYTCIGAMEEARIALDNATTDRADVGSTLDTGGDDSGIPWELVRRQVTEAIAGDAAPGEATRLLAAHILKNTLRQTSHGAMTAQLANRAPFNSDAYKRIFGSLAEADAKGGRMKIVAFAGSVPYIQGLLLFLLSCAFPFFTMFLLMPGRWTAFFIWMTMWLWVKSWDVGFAVVHFIREYMWDFMQGGVSCGQGGVDWTNPPTVYSVINDCDPLATSNTYYHIIALLTLSVPMITAHFCMGATQLYSAFKGSIEAPANRFGDRFTAERRQLETTTPVEQQLVVEMENYALAKAAEAAGQPVDFSEGVGQFAKQDGTLPRNIHAAYERAKFDFKMERGGRYEQMRIAAAQSNGRREDYLNYGDTLASNYSKGYTINDYQNQHQGATIGDFTSTKGEDKSGNLESMASGALSKPGDETAGISTATQGGDPGSDAD